MIQVDVRGERIGRRVPVDVPLVGTSLIAVSAIGGFPVASAIR